MSRIHPTNNRCQDLCIKEGSSGFLGVKAVDINNAGDGDDDVDGSANPPCPAAAAAAVLTVWKRSSMTFQGTDGFTVFDGNGRLAFRVDNYSRKKGHLKGAGLVLMDGAGKPLLTLKPQEQILSMQCQWNGYIGEGGCGKKGLNNSSNLLFSMRRSSSGQDEEAQVFMGGALSKKQAADYRIEGSFRRRNCWVTSAGTGQVVAKIARKKVNPTLVLGDDVFSLVVLPGFDSQLIMAFVMILDRICVKPFTPFLCS